MLSHPQVLRQVNRLTKEAPEVQTPQTEIEIDSVSNQDTFSQGIAKGSFIDM